VVHLTHSGVSNFRLRDTRGGGTSADMITKGIQTSWNHKPRVDSPQFLGTVPETDVFKNRLFITTDTTNAKGGGRKKVSVL